MVISGKKQEEHYFVGMVLLVNNKLTRLVFDLSNALADCCSNQWRFSASHLNILYLCCHNVAKHLQHVGRLCFGGIPHLTGGPTHTQPKA